MQIQYEYDHEAFGRRLQIARERAGYATQEVLAKDMDVSAKYISKLETGVSTPSLPYIMKFAELTHTDLNTLLLPGYEGESRQAPEHLYIAESSPVLSPDAGLSRKGRKIYYQVSKYLEEILRESQI